MTVLERAGDVSVSPRGMPASLLRAVRPNQWVKNLLVLAAPAAAGVILHPDVALRCGLALVAMVCTSCAGYLVNDVCDRELDRAHPRKRTRPIASGAVSIRAAMTAVAVLFSAGFGLAAAAGALVLLCTVTYALLTVGYAVRLKHVAFWEMGVLSSGFLLRTLAGAAAARVPVSGWLLLTVSAAACHVVVGKRVSELHTAGGAFRPVLCRYRARGLGRASQVSAVVLCAGYVGWALTRGQLAEAARVGSVLSVLPVLVVVSRWSRLNRAGLSDAPELVLVHDRTIRWGVVSWVAIFSATVWLR